MGTEEGDVVGQAAGQDLGALGDHADRGPQGLEVELEDVGAAEQDGAGLRLGGPRQQRRQRRLARAGAADERAGVAGGDEEVDVAQGEGAGLVGEVQVAELHVERPVGQRQAAGRLGARGQHAAQPQHRAEALLQVGQVPGEHVDLADELGGHQEQRDQRGGRQVAAGDQGDAQDPGAGQHAGEQGAAAPGDAGLHGSTASSAACTAAATRALRRRT